MTMYHGLPEILRRLLVEGNPRSRLRVETPGQRGKGAKGKGAKGQGAKGAKGQSAHGLLIAQPPESTTLGKTRYAKRAVAASSVFLIGAMVMVLATIWTRGQRASGPDAGSGVASGSPDHPQPVNWTTAQDHQNMMEQLGIKGFRPGPSGKRTRRTTPITTRPWPIPSRTCPKS